MTAPVATAAVSNVAGDGRLRRFLRPVPRRDVASSHRTNLWGYLFLSPWLLGLLLLTTGPVLAALALSFTRYDLFGSPDLIGIENYRTMLSDARLVSALRVTLVYVFLSVPLNLAFALFVAVSLNRPLGGLAWYRALFYLPSLLGGSVAIALLWRQVFGRDGLFNDTLGLFGVQGQSWIVNPDTSLYTLIALHVWQFGSPMVIFLAGLKQIPQELYEAAALDGAGNIRRFRNVTLPLLTPVILFNLVLQIISSFQTFTPAYIVSGGNGGPVDSTLFYTLYIYQEGFENFRMGYASALSWLLLVIIAIVTGLVFWTSKKWVHYS